MVDHVDKVAQNLSKELHVKYSTDFEKVLQRMRWPGKSLTLAEDVADEWRTNVERLLQLQEPYVTVSFLHLLKEQSTSYSSTKAETSSPNFTTILRLNVQRFYILANTNQKDLS